MKIDCFYTSKSDENILLRILNKSEYDEWINTSLDITSSWLLSSNRTIKKGNHYLVPSQDGKLDQVIVIVDNALDMWTVADLPWSLPTGVYYFSDTIPLDIRQNMAIGWGLGAYRYTRYKSNREECAKLLLHDDLDHVQINAAVNASYLVRDLVNTPANDMMPVHLAESARLLADEFDAEFTEIVGEQLLAQNYPLIHSVGRASEYEPRLLKISWGEETNPLVCLIGKGVCFDSGGLDIKPASGMRWMKKDMGGAAHVLGIARYIMETNIPVRLFMFIPAVENAISGNAFRPGDIISSRKGTTVEIDNTDAEGRLILADAITEACEYNPDILIDFATLTGAARVALGTEVGVFFANSDSIAHDLYKAGKTVQDDIWRLPIHRDYKQQLKSTVADMVNCSNNVFGGAITAALFLEHFVDEGCNWIHFDIMAYNTRARAGRPKGGEAMGMRSICQYLDQRYRTK